MRTKNRCLAGANGRRLARALEGRPILVSYADLRTSPAWWLDTLKPMLEEGAFPFAILDSGAFTVASQGIAIDVDEYAAFAREHAALFACIVNLDSIAGDLEESRSNLESLRSAGIPAIPVFHEGEPWSELDEMAESTGYIGIGFARHSCHCGRPEGRHVDGCKGGQLKSGLNARRAWLAQVFERAGDRVKIHGFAMNRHANEYPFFSTDSTTWIAEYRGLRKLSPGEPCPTSHGVGGELAERLSAWSLDELLELAVGSYADHGATGEPNEQAERDAKGQARTICRRYGAHLDAALEAIEARQLRKAA